MLVRQLRSQVARACTSNRSFVSTQHLRAAAPRMEHVADIFSLPGDRPVGDPPAAEGQLTHLDGAGTASMVDVGGKSSTQRIARASARVHIGKEAFRLVAANLMKKGDVLSVAQIAGIQGAKLTSQLIPLCHPIPLSSVNVKLTLDAAAGDAVDILAEARTIGQTGVEMEALAGAAVAGLTVIDMVKAVTKEARIEHVQIEFKSGGKSGEFQRAKVGTEV